MFQYNTIEEAVQALRNGEIILVTDDENRENEGDMICAAEFATTENVNFMAAHAKGLICMPMSIELCQKLHLPQMVDCNTDITQRHLPFLSTILIPRQVFLPRSAVLLQESVSKITQDQRTFAVRVICSRSPQRKTEYSNERDIQRLPLILCALQD